MTATPITHWPHFCGVCGQSFHVGDGATATDIGLVHAVCLREFETFHAAKRLREALLCAQ